MMVLWERMPLYAPLAVWDDRGAVEEYFWPCDAAFEAAVGRAYCSSAAERLFSLPSDRRSRVLLVVTIGFTLFLNESLFPPGASGFEMLLLSKQAALLGGAFKAPLTAIIALILLSDLLRW